MQFYALDVISEITLRRSFGLIEAGYDKDELLHAVHVGSMSYGSMVGAYRIKKIGKLPQFTINDVIGTNIGAGSDTTGISMNAVIYFLSPSLLAETS
ncbi:hypothetical protein N7522_011894 [Penicillium canescens]|nr:hypothetical protein N7522_011894 [Penicillium canescens]